LDAVVKGEGIGSLPEGQQIGTVLPDGKFVALKGKTRYGSGKWDKYEFAISFALDAQDALHSLLLWLGAVPHVQVPHEVMEGRISIFIQFHTLKGKFLAWVRAAFLQVIDLSA
jgi:hypothetical protein